MDMSDPVAPTDGTIDYYYGGMMPRGGRINWFQSLRGLGLVLEALFVVLAGLGLIRAVLWAGLGREVEDLVFDRMTIEEFGEASSDYSQVSLVSWAVIAVTGLLFVVWLWRAYRNLDAFSVRMKRFPDFWVWLGWFVPFMQFWRPKQLINDAWRGSEPGARYPDGSWLSRPVPLLMTAWWALYVFTTFSEFVSAWWLFDLTAEGVSASNGWRLATEITVAVDAVLAAAVVHLLTARQHARHDLIRAVSRDAASPPGGDGGRDVEVEETGDAREAAPAELVAGAADPFVPAATSDLKPRIGTPAWHPDPLGRAAYRWFDGRRWTDRTSDSRARA